MLPVDASGEGVELGVLLGEDLGVVGVDLLVGELGWVVGSGGGVVAVAAGGEEGGAVGGVFFVVGV